LQLNYGYCKKNLFLHSIKILKENMSQEIIDEPIVDVEQALTKTELYIEQNKKSLIIITATIVVLVGGYFAYKYWYVAGEETIARGKMFKAEQYFANDSLDKAINGDGNAPGFIEIADEYGVTPSGNLAHYYLGISYLKKGQYEEAIAQLKEFDSADQIVGPEATGAIGDANMELGNTDEAITYYLKAAEQNVNNFSSPVFLKKAAMANEDKGNYADAVKIYERIKNEFSETADGKDMEKYISRAKTLGNL
jgi:tetratricopeptide (TPR) repeat protein